MDFWYHFQLQNQKLKNSNSIDEMLDEDGKIQSDYLFLDDFRDHLPLAPEEFWQTVICNIIEYKSDQHFQLDKPLMQYILAVISWYTDESFSNTASTNHSGTTALLASQFYFHLMNLVELKYFRGTLYEHSLNYLGKYLKKHKRSDHCVNFLKSLRKFLVHKKLKKEYLEMTLFKLCEVVECSSVRVHTDFALTNSSDSSYEALLCIKCLADQNWPAQAQFMINYALLNGIRSENESEPMKKSFRNLMIDLKPVLRKENFINLQNVFLYIVTKSKSFDPLEASRFMITFDEHFFKDTIFKLTAMGVSKEVSDKGNLLRLFSKLLENLPTNYYEPQKLEVFIQSLLNICVLNCINNEEAISLVSKICLLNKQVINKQFEILLNNPTEYIYVENSLSTFCMKFNVHWLNRARNRNVAVIIIRIMSNTFNITSDEQYAGILAMMGNEADATDLKIAIPLLLNLFVVSKQKHSKHVAEKVLELMYSMALQRSSGSVEFVKTLFRLIQEPTDEIRPYKTQFITTLSSLIIGDNKEFISKAHELKLLESNCVKKMINTLLHGDYDGLRLTCAVVEKAASPQGEKLIYHIMANPNLLAEAKYTGDLLFIVNSGLFYFINYQRNMSLTPVQESNLRDFTKLLWDRMLKLLLPFTALGVGLDVLKSLSELMNEPLNYDLLFQTVNFETKNSLLKIPDATHSISIMYSAELLSNKEYDVPEDIINVLENTLDRILQASRNSDSTGNIKLFARHHHCLVLIVRLAMKHSKLGTKALNCVKSSIDSSNVDPEFKMFVMELMYDLCTYVVHNFDEFLQYSFKDLKSLNMSNRKQAAVHIEHFIRMDFLKLSSEQFCKFISLLGDPVIEKSVQKLINNFILTNQGVVEKYFLALIMHVNFYSVHPMCPMSSQYMQDMNCIIRANFNKWKVFSTLFRSLPIRSKFLILKDICLSFFEEFIHGKMKIEDGIWNVITDSISLFKMMAYKSLDNINYEEFYDKGFKGIKKYLLDKKSISQEKALKHPDMRDSIECITYSLLHLLFYTENETILRNYKLKLFEAILFWTHDLLPDIAALCIVRREKKPSKILNYYQRLNQFYENHKECLNLADIISECNEANVANQSS